MLLFKRYSAQPALTACLLALLVAAGCRTAEKVTEKAPPKPVFTDEEIAQANDLYVQGILQFEMENYEYALDLLTMAYVRLNDNAGVNFALADAYIATSDLVNAAFYAGEAVNLEPENKFYRIKLVEVHLRAGNTDEAIAVLRSGLEYTPRDLEILFLLAGSLQEKGVFRESNEVYDRILAITGSDITIHYQKFRNYAALDEAGKALTEMEQINKLDPGNVAAVQTLGQLYIENEEQDKAEKAYLDYLGKNPDTAEVKVSLADLYITNNDWDKAGDLLRSVMADSLLLPEAKRELTQFLLTRFQEEPANETLQGVVADIIGRYADEQPDNAEAQSMAADFFTMTGETEQAIEKLESVVRLLPENANAWRLLLQLLYASQRFDDVIGRADEAESNAPYDVFIRFFTGGSYYMKQDYSNAIRWLKMAAEAPSRPAFRSIVNGTLADAYHADGNWPASTDAYEEAIRLDPENAIALNNYAYYLTIRGESIDKAYEMSKKSNQIEPENPSYLDTLGWIYFQKGEYTKAYEYILASIENGSESAEVYEHMGDVLEKLGRVNEAVSWWVRALEKDAKRDYLKEKINL